MKKRFLLLSVMLIAIISVFVISASAATTDEFGEMETIPNIELSGMNSDTTSRVVIVDANGEYHTYPASYVVSDNTKFYYNFTPINTALGTSYDKNSIVRIEVPDNVTVATNCGDLSSTSNLVEIVFSENSQLTTLEYGCFYNNKKLKKLNIPKSVTNISTLIINSCAALEELIFDDGFSADIPADSFRGATGLKKVVFSNQITTVASKAFEGTLGEELEELRLGTGLVNWGYENLSWVKQSVKIYAHSNFLANEEKITMNTFSWWNDKACLPTGVLFFTGTKEQAQALINKSTYDRVISSNSVLVEWDSTKTDDSYVPTSGWTIVYGYNTCKAFYNDVHKGDDGDCTTADTCTRCNTTFEAKESHNITVNTLVYANGLGSTGVRNYICDNEGCYAVDEVNKEYEAIIGAKGYSFKENDKTGLDGGYSINTKLLALYEELNGSVKIGIIIVNAEDAQKNGLVDESFELISTKGMKVEMSSREYSYFDLKITGFNTEKLQNLGLIITSYVIDDFDGDGAEEIKYVQHKMSDANESPVTIGGVVYNTVTVERAYKEKYPTEA